MLRVFLAFLACLASGYAGYCVRAPLEVSGLRDANDSLIEALGRAAAEQTATTDIIMRFSHYTDYHDVHSASGEYFLCCPECGTGQAFSEGNAEQQDEPLSYKAFCESFSEYNDEPYRQSLEDDALEVLHGIESLRFGIAVQERALSHTLSRLRSVKIKDK